MLTPENCGASDVACQIINNTFLSLDGFAQLRAQCDRDSGGALRFAGELARVADREIRDGAQLGEDAARAYAFELLDEYSDLTLGHQSMVVESMVTQLFETDPWCKVRRDRVKELVVEIEHDYVSQ